MTDQMSPRILVAALATLLADALDQAETRHLANERFSAELGALRARVERELETHSGRQRLRLADEPGASVADD